MNFARFCGDMMKASLLSYEIPTLWYSRISLSQSKIMSMYNTRSQRTSLHGFFNFIKIVDKN